MTREEAIKKLEPFIPSIKRDYYRWGEKTDKSKDKTWLYRDKCYRKPDAVWNDPDRERYIPEVIPKDFLEGVTAEVDGKKFKAKRSFTERDYRRVYLQITDFACYGNTHKYGTLKIDGLHWCGEGKNGYTTNRKLFNEEPRVTGIWSVNLFRIVKEGEMNESECPAGEATARFVYLDELIATAVYVSLLRVDGPFVLDNSSSYATVRTADDILVTVGADGNVEWGKKLIRIFNI